MQCLDLRHHGFINRQSTGGINQHHIVKLDLGVLDGRFGNRHRLLVRARGEEIHFDFFGQGFELVDGCRAINVGRHYQDFLLLAFAQVAGQFGHRGGFTRTL